MQRLYQARHECHLQCLPDPDRHNGLIYIDEFRNYHKRIGRAGPFWCHLIADSTEELLAFAVRIGLQPRWIQKAGTPQEHFDIGSQPIRDRAIALGATELSARELAQKMAARRRNQS